MTQKRIFSNDEIATHMKCINTYIAKKKSFLNRPLRQSAKRKRREGDHEKCKKKSKKYVEADDSDVNENEKSIEDKLEHETEKLAEGVVPERTEELEDDSDANENEKSKEDQLEDETEKVTERDVSQRTEELEDDSDANENEESQGYKHEKETEKIAEEVVSETERTEKLEKGDNTNEINSKRQNNEGHISDGDTSSDGNKTNDDFDDSIFNA